MPDFYRFKFSLCQLLFISAAHAVALLVVACTKLPTVGQFTWSLVVAISWAIGLVFLLGRAGRRKVDALRYTQDKIICYANSVVVFSGVLLPRSVVTPFFILLLIEAESQRGKCYVLICRDQLTATEFRQLSVRLRLA